MFFPLLRISLEVKEYILSETLIAPTKFSSSVSLDILIICSSDKVFMRYIPEFPEII